MFLRSLTLRGFKSFASSTTLALEPGITCVVGPNGSGKSNVVDALAWVMGEQGAKSLRGARMDDVIFAGTSGRPPLGRAEVVLTIDNTDGALPIEYAEVTISRTMFRNGGSDYKINGQTCRLLDVQELLSDSGIGREMHVIVGQGQLDAILRASPEERRGFVEEAAGVLKYRKRKEKALRKLDATEGNLTRLGDLLSEIRRQLKPLGRQAEVARRAAVVQMESRDARARLLADDVVTLSGSLQRELADEEAMRSRRAEVDAALVDARVRETELEAALSSDAPLLGQAQETWFALSRVQERLRSTHSLAAERVRNTADEPDDERLARDPVTLEAEAAHIRAQEDEIARDLDSSQGDLDESIALRRASELAHAEEDRRIADLMRTAADRREGLARLDGEVNVVKSRAAAADDEIGRLVAARAEADTRAQRARRDFTALETTIAGLDAGERGLDTEHEGAAGWLADIQERFAKLRLEAESAERHRAALAARREALELGLSRKDGVGALLAPDAPVRGLLGSVAALLSVRAGDETAVAAALGSAADAVAMTDTDAACDAIAFLKADDLGRGSVVVAGAGLRSGDGSERSSWPVLQDATYLVDAIDIPDILSPAIARLLARTALVSDLAAARTLLADQPDLVAVTRDGDVVGAHVAAGGSPSQLSLLEVQAAVDEVSAAIDSAAASAERMRFELTSLEAERAEAQGRVDVALAKLHESDATLAAIAEHLGQLGSVARAAKAETERIDAAITAAAAARETDLSGLVDLQGRLDSVGTVAEEEPDTSYRERLAQQASSARRRETDARLALRTVEERARALRGRADSLVRAAEQERLTQARLAARRARRHREARAAVAVGRAVEVVLVRLEDSLAQALQRRTTLETARAERSAESATGRARVRTLEAELATLTDTVHRDEMLRSEHRLRIEQLEQRVLDELGFDLESLVEEYGPDRLVPVIVAADALSAEGANASLAADEARGSEPAPYVREEQQRRLRTAERALAQLGRINPLALEEFGALEERHRFLTEQLEDLKKTRHHLLDIVREVDGRVEEVFTEAYNDVAREFAGVFARLFPGGEGRLVLTDPDDMLTAGIDIEPRPPGKKIKRLSLLSGGERSLVAVTFLVALFRARPSPFYILDEVEAALDDTNLGRLLEIYEELRESSQLVVITHQKRTMEVADALYGVTMRGDGVSAVISQRLRERDPA